MTTVLHVLLLFLHTAIAWIGVEIYVNKFHDLPRIWFILWHYIVVLLFFGIVFGLYTHFLAYFPPFETMVIAITWLFVIEFIMFRYLYSAELWFLNYVDWIVPVFIAASAVYAAGVLV